MSKEKETYLYGTPKCRSLQPDDLPHLGRVNGSIFVPLRSVQNLPEVPHFWLWRKYVRLAETSVLIPISAAISRQSEALLRKYL